VLFNLGLIFLSIISGYPQNSRWQFRDCR